MCYSSDSERSNRWTWGISNCLTWALFPFPSQLKPERKGVRRVAFCSSAHRSVSRVSPYSTLLKVNKPLVPRDNKRKVDNPLTTSSRGNNRLWYLGISLCSKAPISISHVTSALYPRSLFFLLVNCLLRYPGSSDCPSPISEGKNRTSTQNNMCKMCGGLMYNSFSCAPSL